MGPRWLEEPRREDMLFRKLLWPQDSCRSDCHWGLVLLPLEPVKVQLLGVVGNSLLNWTLSSLFRSPWYLSIIFLFGEGQPGRDFASASIRAP